MACNMAIKNKIKRLVDDMGIPRYKFAQDTGVALNTAYYLYKNPNQIPTADVMEKICDRYDLQPGDLLEYIRDTSRKAG